MDLSKYLPTYPDFNEDEEPYYSLVRKNEFYETRLARYEPKPTVAGTWMNHQVFMSRFLSGRTPYQSILLMHEPGTGKTCTSVAAIESIREEHCDMKGALVLMTGEGLISNYKNEVVFVCTNGTYVPKDYKRLNKRQQQIRITKNLDTFYEFRTYDKFSRMIQEEWNEEYIKKNYSNKIIILDEVHNLRQHDPNLKQEYIVLKKQLETRQLSYDQQRIYSILHKKYGTDDPDSVTLHPSEIKEVHAFLSLKRYTSIYQFLHTITNCKILLLSGTPMRDQPTELIDIMNLILPQRLQVHDYFENNRLIDDKKPLLKQQLKGYVSYLKAMKSDVVKQYMVNPAYSLPLENVSLYGLQMSDFQSTVYKNAQQMDHHTDDKHKKCIVCNKKPPKFAKLGEKIATHCTDCKDPRMTEIKKSGIYSQTRQANLCVFPDGSFGRKGYESFLTNRDMIKNMVTHNGTQTRVSQMIANIREYSCKYAECIQKIMDFPRDSHFIYSEYVKGSGALIFKAMLDVFDFKQVTVKVKDDRPAYMGDDDEDVEDDDDDDEKEKQTEKELEQMGKRKRYAILTADTTKTAKEITAITTLFNHDDNMHGEYIQLVIGSSLVSEGFTLKNVQHVHILTPDWNFSGLDQIIARSYRLFSHNALLSAGEDVRVRIYLYCAVSNETELPIQERSIDYHMLETSRNKDYAIKQVERLLKEVSVDCFLNKERNRSFYPDIDHNTRDCEYQSCDYQCDGIAREQIDKEDRDYSTYNLYYDKKELAEITEQIKRIFLTQTKIKINVLLSHFDSYNEISVLKAMYNMIITNDAVIDRLGYHCFLRSDYEYLYVTRRANHIGTFLDSYYVDHFSIEKHNTEEWHMLSTYVIPYFNEEKDIQLFSPSIREMILEESYHQDDHNIQVLFKDSVSVRPDGTIVSTLLAPLLRCKTGEDEWQTCTHPEHQTEQQYDFVTENEWDLVGQIRNDNLYLFVPSTMKAARNKKERPTGVLCGTSNNYQKKGLIMLFIRLKVPLPGIDTVGDMSSIKTVLLKYMKEKDLRKTEELIDVLTQKYEEINPDPSERASKEDMIRFLYWKKSARNDMCPLLRQWLQQHGILFDDKGVKI
jgi:hypothetical protein